MRDWIDSAHDKNYWHALVKNKIPPLKKLCYQYFYFQFTLSVEAFKLN